jgi:succinylglutamate desuccinylase
MFVAFTNDILNCKYEGKNFIEEIIFPEKVTFHVILHTSIIRGATTREIAVFSLLQAKQWAPHSREYMKYLE